MTLEETQVIGANKVKQNQGLPDLMNAKLHKRTTPDAQKYESRPGPITKYQRWGVDFGQTHLAGTKQNSGEQTSVDKTQTANHKGESKGWHKFEENKPKSLKCSGPLKGQKKRQLTEAYTGKGVRFRKPRLARTGKGAIASNQGCDAEDRKKVIVALNLLKRGECNLCDI